jgi:DNA-binding Lrp family transcriptional regulator
MIEEVVECYHITGQADFLLKILTKDIPTYQKLILEKLSKIEEIGSMQSMISLASFKESKVLPLG